jgi:hypothetical protein
MASAESYPLPRYNFEAERDNHHGLMPGQYRNHRSGSERLTMYKLQSSNGRRGMGVVGDYQYSRRLPAGVTGSKHRCGRVAIGPEQPGSMSILFGRTSS